MLLLGVVVVVLLLALPALVPVLLEDRDRRSRSVAWDGVPEVESTTALRGFKVAQLVVDVHSGQAWLHGVTGRAYSVDVVASCPRRRCRPPGLDCICGFYAWRHRERALELLDELSAKRPGCGYALLTVDLDGSVLEHEHGFRGARQRVHRIELPGECPTCADPSNPADTVLVADPSQQLRQGLAARSGPLGTGLTPGTAVVRPVCAAHVPLAAARRVDLGTLRGLVGTEVDLLPR